MNQQLTDILNTFKHKHQFPPREKALQRKSQGHAHLSSMGAIAVTRIYIESASAVLDGFTEAVLRNRASLGLASDKEISEVFLEAFNIVTNEARGCSLSEFGQEF